MNIKTSGAPLSLEEAVVWTSNYRSTLATGNETRAMAFSKDVIQQILDQDTCSGMRIYLGLDKADDLKFILVGVNDSGQDLADGMIIDYGLPCPSGCDGNSPLTTERP